MKLSKRAYASLARSVPRWVLTCGSHLPADVGRQRGRNRRKPDLLVLEDRRLLSTFTVTSTADDGSSHTLRWAVAQANAATTASSIEIELGSSAATITLTEGQLELSNTEDAITIYDGSGARAGDHLGQRRQPGVPDRFPGHGDNHRPHDRQVARRTATEAGSITQAEPPWNSRTARSNPPRRPGWAAGSTAMAWRR